MIIVVIFFGKKHLRAVMENGKAIIKYKKRKGSDPWEFSTMQKPFIF
jgi:hypothetical protein